jgi:hypothetical protein
MSALELNGAEPAALTPIVMSSSRVKAINYAASQELATAEPDLAFSARVFAQVSLPYREPKQVDYWERRNGDTVLTVRPALLVEPDGSRRTAFPFGLIPRHALTWMATEALRTNSPELELGRSMTSFMKKLDLAHNGQNAKRLTEHLRRLFGSQLTVDGLAVDENGHGAYTEWFQLAESVQLWFSDNDQPGLWSSRVKLSDQFFKSIIDHPVPLDLNAVKALGKSPLRLDLYLWLTHRMSYLETTSRVSWVQLNGQFGSQYAQIPKFKHEFIKHLDLVKIVYPGLNVEVTDDYLILRRSNTHIPQLPGARRSRLKLLGDAS